ncbi:MAG TPA: hypothetical protein VI195_06875 [Steroidobacteraceae bacterium]
MRPLGYAALACLLGANALCLADCGGAQPKAQAQLAAIVAGCKVSLDLERDAGEAGAIGETEQGCRAALHTWERAK